MIMEQLQQEHPEILERFQENRARLERRLEEQDPEAARRLHQWEERLRQAEKSAEAGPAETEPDK